MFNLSSNTLLRWPHRYRTYPYWKLLIAINPFINKENLVLLMHGFANLVILVPGCLEKIALSSQIRVLDHGSNQLYS